MLESELLQRRALLDRYLGKGLIISVSWTKKDGTLAKRQVRLWKESALTSGTREFVKPNPVSHKPNLYTCYEITSGQQQEKWCNISLDGLVEVKACGNTHQFN